MAEWFIAPSWKGGGRHSRPMSSNLIPSSFYLACCPKMVSECSHKALVYPSRVRVSHMLLNCPNGVTVATIGLSPIVPLCSCRFDSYLGYHLESSQMLVCWDRLLSGLSSKMTRGFDSLALRKKMAEW